ncbi:hypothetical protein ACTU44_17165 [Thalassospira sp. SM2505]
MAGRGEALVQNAREKLDIVVHKFLQDLSSYPGWEDWQRGKVRYTIASHPDFSEFEGDSSPFEFEEPIKQKHDVLLQYLGLVRAADALAETEYYFRRFPFRELPVSRSNHIVNICELYFTRFYQLCERIKKYLNALNLLADKTKVDTGSTVKQVKKIFDHELRSRNRITHHETFSSAEIDLLALYESRLVGSDKGLQKEVTYLYRKITSDWATRVKRKVEIVTSILEVIASATLEVGDFEIKSDIERLQQPGA